MWISVHYGIVHFLTWEWTRMKLTRVVYSCIWSVLVSTTQSSHFCWFMFLSSALGGWYSYRMSKAALNMATRNLSIELGRGSSKIVCVSLHPGTVNTDLSRPYHRNVPEDKLFSTEYSVQCLMNIIDTLNIDKTGKAYAWDSTEIPW